MRGYLQSRVVLTRLVSCNLAAPGMAEVAHAEALLALNPEACDLIRQRCDVPPGEANALRAENARLRAVADAARAYLKVDGSGSVFSAVRLHEAHGLLVGALDATNGTEAPR